MTPQEYLSHMISIVQNGDQLSIKKVEQDIVNRVYILSFVVNDVATIPDEYDEYVQLNREILLLINDVDVYQWSEVLYGSYEGGNAGWLVEEAENELEQDVMETLSFFGIEWPPSRVPKPEELKEPFGNLLSKIYLLNGIELGGSHEEIDYWIIDEAFVSEPQLGGKQIGELPDVDLTRKIVVKMTQEQFDELMEAHYKIYGEYPYE